MRIRKYIITLLMAFALMSQTVYADEPSTAETSTEDTAEKKTEASKNTSTEGSTDKTEATTKAVTETSSETTTEATTEDPMDQHGEIVNTSSGEYLIQGTTQIKKVTDAIDKINENTNKEDIMRIRYMYNALTMAQKSRVPNESILYSWEKKYGITYDYSSIELPSDADSTDSKKAVSYTYTISNETPSISVSIKYISDNDADGNMDVPEINLKSPDGSIISISLGMTEIKNTNMFIKFTWTPTFMQMDIADSTKGKWTITTDTPVIFTSMDYAGSLNDIEPIPEYTREDVKEDTPAKKNVKSKTHTSTFIRIGLAVALVAGYIAWSVMSKNKKNKAKQAKQQVRIEKLVRSDEDIEKKKRELRSQLEAEDDYKEYESSVREPDHQKPVFQEQPVAEPPKQAEYISNEENVSYWTGNSNDNDDDFLNGFD